jgi:chaperone modulatory protein CbpM
MMNMEELVSAIAELEFEDLHAWIQQELVSPRTDEGAPLFSEKECARVRLICTLYYEMDVEADTLPVVMSLIDQLHETRERIHKLTGAVMAQDEAVRLAILKAMKEN